MIAAALLDTETLSFIMRQHSIALVHARAYLAEHAGFTFSLIMRYEVLRGLKAKNALVQQNAFETFCNANTILPITDFIIVRAADIYADLHMRDVLIGDAAILIAATALEHGLVLVTNNASHFGNVTGLALQTWLTPTS